MRDLLSNMLSLGLGVVAISKEQVEKMVDRLVKRGEMAPEEAKKMVSEIMEKGREGREQLAESIRKQLKRALSELELPTRDDLNALKDRIQVLEERLGQLEEEGDF
ncbi:MAG: polyhydroxyalkanoate synthesis regulator [Firmicutes bacterium]|nr:polyhydroxyalkanoate synthesis regulator [Bacillota bacterium]